MNPGPQSISSDISSNQTFNYVSEMLFYHGNKFLKFINLNVRSLIHNIDQIALEMKDYDIIALTETFLDETIPDDDIYVHGYSKPYRNDRNRHGGGVCIYVRSTLIVERVLECEFQNIECVWLKVRVKGHAFYFGSVYRPPTAGREFWETLDLSIQKVKENGFPEFFSCR